VPSSIVVARPDRLGDVVLSSSCLAPVRARFPDARLHWLIDERMRPLFHHHAAIDEVIALAPEPFGPRVLRLARSFRALQSDAVALLQPDRAIALAAFLAQVPVRAGLIRMRCRPQFLNRAAPYRKSEGRKHEAAYNFDVLGLLGVPEPASLTPALSPDPAARSRVAGKLGADPDEMPPFAAFHLAAHGDKARVPLDVFGRLAGWLSRERGLRIALIGTETDPPAEIFAAAARLDESQLFDARGATDAAELAWLLASARLCVARDSGPAQLAAALGCPTLAFFVDLRPPHGPVRWRPLGPRVENLGIAPDGFPDDAVRSAAARLL
jgi:ADP-heptose:LPS heptosyltransferase